MTMPELDGATAPEIRAAANANDALILDFLHWLAAGPRCYGEVMEAWRTSCPRVTVWEDCVDQGLVVRRADGEGGAVVALTAEGRARLERAGP
jgi:hypothetical protein